MPGKLAVHIHSHGAYEDRTDLKFSHHQPGFIAKQYDEDMMIKFPQLTFYLINPNGQLWVRRGEGYKDGFPINTEEHVIAEGLPYDSRFGNKKLEEDSKKYGYTRPGKLWVDKDDFQY